MIYLYYGTKEYLIKEEIKKITKDFDKYNISVYDLENDLIKNIVDDAYTISLFSAKKLIICENAAMFQRGNNKDNELIEQYLNNPDPNTTIIFTLYNEKIDNTKKITKLIKKIATVKEFNDTINPYEFVKNNFNDYKINNSLIQLLIDRVGSNTLILQNEIDKIKIYKDNNEITKEDIINLTTKKIDIDIFKLIEYIVKNDKEKALEMYYEMLKNNEEPLKIIIMLANQFRIMYQSKRLLNKGFSEKDIAEILKIHPYRVKLSVQNSHNYSLKTLLSSINDLAKMDIEIKTGKINKDLALELFILKKSIV